MPVKDKTAGKTKTSGVSAGPLHNPLSAPMGIRSGIDNNLVSDDLFLFTELTAYPQRSALEPLLAID